MELGSGVTRWVRGILSRRRPEPLDRTRADLVVVVSGFDDVESCSAVLERGAAGSPEWIADAEAVLRHHLHLPAVAVDAVTAIAAQDGYAPSADLDAGTEGPAGTDGTVVLLLERVQVLDALHCSQERSRMAGLAQRHGGTALGWDGLQPLPPA
ncbi:hypothetical protein [Prescottella subtropica]|uniref:hypothetical protein n=1 Tax=Prescottella subtropica TaxID=2545757 RepID=UPI0014781F5E|nr:hypothetical protein [Prescottella subtropica]